MRIAIIGTGIAGMSSAWLLHGGGHDVVVFEGGSHIGGHVNTIPVTRNGKTFAVDTGFIVFNQRTYPNFCQLLDHLGVASRETTMSFSVRDEATNIEYNGHTLATLFAQKRNLLRPTHWRMILDIVHFNRIARNVLDDQKSVDVATFVREAGFSQAFVDRYLVPMAGAIWSLPVGDVLRMPIRFLVRFFANHGFLEIDDRPVWRTVVGGSWSYVSPLVANFRDQIRLNTSVTSVRRVPRGVEVRSECGVEPFDQVVFACHSDQALAMLEDASEAEQQVLGALPYQANEAVLHTDERVLPKRRACWAAWNYHRITADVTHPVPVTYAMNQLQGFDDAPCQFLVTLNHSGHIDPAQVLRRITYHHPRFDEAAVRAQARWSEINGVQSTWFAGAYWRYGFHEDGLLSGLRVAESLGCPAPWAQGGVTTAAAFASC